MQKTELQLPKEKGGSINYQFEVNICTLLYIKQITDKTDNLQHRELYLLCLNNLYGKRMWKKIDIYVCITESLCGKPETNATL